MTKVCKRHADNPVKIYHRCVGCEIESLRQRIKEQEELLKWFRNKISDESTAFGVDCPGGRCEM